MPTTTTTDVVDHLLGVRPGDALDRIRAARPAARSNAQRSYEALFEPVDTTHLRLTERYAVATFVAGLHREPVVAEFYAAQLDELDPGLAAAVAGEVGRGLTEGPYGVYRESGLADASITGPVYEVTARAVLGERLVAALEHAHLLVFRPRESRPEALERLLEAGWTTTGIVSLSQLVSFLAFQIRVVHGLRELARTLTDAPAPDKETQR